MLLGSNPWRRALHHPAAPMSFLLPPTRMARSPMLPILTCFRFSRSTLYTATSATTPPPLSKMNTRWSLPSTSTEKMEATNMSVVVNGLAGFIRTVVNTGSGENSSTPYAVDLMKWYNLPPHDVMQWMDRFIRCRPSMSIFRVPMSYSCLTHAAGDDDEEPTWQNNRKQLPGGSTMTTVKPPPPSSSVGLPDSAQKESAGGGVVVVCPNDGRTILRRPAACGFHRKVARVVGSQVSTQPCEVTQLRLSRSSSNSQGRCTPSATLYSVVGRRCSPPSSP
uniref:Uncharacterized protein n=1 Tax=Oryza nivara TaxID=4536 RepID=A0A0E0HKJ7_ORYNI